MGFVSDPGADGNSSVSDPGGDGNSYVSDPGDDGSLIDFEEPTVWSASLVVDTAGQDNHSSTPLRTRLGGGWGYCSL